MTVKIKDKIRSSLRFSFMDGCFAAVMLGFGDTFVAPYAIALRATNFQVGLLSSLPGLVSSIFQLKIADWTEKTGRKKMMTSWVFAQASMWALIILMPFIFSGPVPFVIGGVVLYALFGAFAGPAWLSIMSQYLPGNKRGHYFSWRYSVHGFITLGATFLAGYILYLFPRESFYGFTLIFAGAMISRFLSWYYLNRMYEPPLHPKPEAYFSFYDFLSRSRNSNFAKFVFFAGGMSLAVNLAAPFFAVFMLRDLRFDYLSFTIVNTTMTLAMLISFRRWGAYADKHGCIRVISLTSWLIPVIPVLWLVSQNIWWLILIQILSGFVWAGFNLAVSNFIFDAVSEEKRVRCISYFNLINGLGVFVGAALGGLLINQLPPVYGHGFFALILISGFLRLAVRMVFMPRLKEVKNVERISNLELFFKTTGVKPIVGAVQGVFKQD
jgi:MFS family permease